MKRKDSTPPRIRFVGVFLARENDGRGTKAWGGLELCLFRPAHSYLLDVHDGERLNFLLQSLGVSQLAGTFDFRRSDPERLSTFLLCEIMRLWPAANVTAKIASNRKVGLV